jgi:hypothetical protein
MSEEKIEYHSRQHGWLAAEEAPMPAHVPPATGEQKHLRIVDPDGTPHVHTARPHGHGPGHWRYVGESEYPPSETPAEPATAENGLERLPPPGGTGIEAESDDGDTGPSENPAENAMEQAYESTPAADALGPGTVAHPRRKP